MGSGSSSPISSSSSSSSPSSPALSSRVVLTTVYFAMEAMMSLSSMFRDTEASTPTSFSESSSTFTPSSGSVPAVA